MSRVKVADEMAAAVLVDEPVPIEPALVLDTFVTGLMRPEDHGGHVRLVCYADRPMGGETERVIVARLVFPRQAFLEALTKMLQTIKPKTDVPNLDGFLAAALTPQ